MQPPVIPDKKIKILRLIARMNIGGPAVHVITLTAGLDRARFEQLLVTGRESASEGSMIDYALSKGVRALVIPEIFNSFSITHRDLIALIRLYHLMRQQKPHIVDTHTARAGFLGRLAARLAGVPVVIHTYHGHVLHGYWGAAKTWLIRVMERALAGLTDRIVTVSEQVKKELVGHGVAKPEQISVIPLGFDLEPFLRCEVHRSHFREELALPRDARLVGIVGRLFPIKNHSLFLQAAARIAAREPAARFVIVGDGVLRSTLEQQSKELGIADRVVFTGWRYDLPRIYADLDVLVISSDNEGTPVSAIEAMASSCPVVATRVGGLPDLIVDYETGILVAPRDAGGLASAVLQLLHDPGLARNIGRHAMTTARERFPVQRLVADMDNLYRILLEQKAVSTNRVHANTVT